MIGSGVHHVSINVDDVDTCRDFYVDVLGMEQLDRPDLGFPGAWLAIGDQQIHLLQLPQPPAMGQHFALHVADIQAAVAELRAKGIDVDDPRPLADVCWQANITDPAGNAIELNQPM